MTTPTREEWKQLYNVLAQVYHLAPWQWLEDTHIFGVEDPFTHTVGYVSVQGAHDEDPGVVLYMGDQGWHAYWALVEFAAEAGTVPEEMAFSVPMLVATWVRKEELAEHEVALVQELGLAPDEEEGWPIVRSFRPGWSPWYLTGEEVRFFTRALEQLLLVAPTLEGSGGDALLTHLAAGEVLVRVPGDTSSPQSWVSEWRPFPEEQEEPYHVRIPGTLLDEYRQLLPNREEVQIDFFMLPTAMTDAPDERPYIPYLLLLVDKEKETIIDARIFHAREGVREMYEHIPGEILAILHKHSIRPSRLRVRTERLRTLLEGIVPELTMELEKNTTLRPLDRFRISLLEKVVKAGYVDEEHMLYVDLEGNDHSSA